MGGGVSAWKRALACMAAFALVGCADYTTRKAQNDPDINPDPYEGFNRAMFGVNKALDAAIIRPVTYVYRNTVPDGGQRAVTNFVHNLGSPVVFVNSVLQGDQQNSFATFWRFMVNTTFGVGGLFDVASEAGLKNRDADFGETLATWGVPSGNYLFLPVFGPGTERDTFGRVVDIFFNPTVWISPSWPSYAQFGLTVVDKRSTNWTLIEDTFKTSLDPYATFRSGYLQRRTSEISKVRQMCVSGAQ